MPIRWTIDRSIRSKARQAFETRPRRSRCQWIPNRQSFTPKPAVNSRFRIISTSPQAQASQNGDMSCSHCQPTPHASSIISHMVQCSGIMYNALAHIRLPACASPPLSSSSDGPLLSRSSRLVASLAVVAWSGNHNPLVDVVLASGLVTTLGLYRCVSDRVICLVSEHLTGVPQGLTG